MSEFVIAPLEEPPWRVGAEALAVLLRRRWPGVRVGESVEGSSMALEALIPLVPAPRDLGIALSGTAQAVSLDPADGEGAAEFAVWFVETVLVGGGTRALDRGGDDALGRAHGGAECGRSTAAAPMRAWQAAGGRAY